MNNYIYVITVDSVVYASFDNMKAMQDYADFFFDAVVDYKLFLKGT